MKAYITANQIEEPELKDHILGMLNAIYVNDDLGNRYLMNLLGGHVFVAETEDDAIYIASQLTEGDPVLVCKGQFVEYIVCNNNCGGPSYYIATGVTL